MLAILSNSWSREVWYSVSLSDSGRSIFWHIPSHYPYSNAFGAIWQPSHAINYRSGGSSRLSNYAHGSPCLLAHVSCSGTTGNQFFGCVGCWIGADVSSTVTPALPTAKVLNWVPTLSLRTKLEVRPPKFTPSRLVVLILLFSATGLCTDGSLIWVSFLRPTKIIFFWHIRKTTDL